MKQNKKINIISVILIAVIVVCVTAIAVYFIREKRAADIYEEMQQQNTQTTEKNEIAVQGTELEEPSHAVYEDLPEVDFQSLWETNTDISAWITVPGTQVNYPVLRNASASGMYDTYYLNHTVEKTSGLPGAIFMEPCNEADFTDNNTVIYGHNMKNGSMFGDLYKFKDNVFLEENKFVYVVTPEKNLIYEIFAVVVYDDRHIMGSYDFDSTSDYQKFLDSLVSNRNMEDLFRDETQVTTDQKIITMSTCVKGQDDKRLLVEAVLVDEYER